MDLISWIDAKNGLMSRDLWNIRELSETVVDGSPIDFSEELKRCIDALQHAGMRPITSYNNEPKWVETFYEKGIDTTLYDDIMQQVYGSGVHISNYFWIGKRLPSIDEIYKVELSYR